jgi:hypothetical protein
MPHSLQFRPERQPVPSILLSLLRLLSGQRSLKLLKASWMGVGQERPLDLEATASRRIPLCDLDEQLGSAQLEQPEADLRWLSSIPVLEIVSFHETANHRPILVSLSLLGLHEIREREQVARKAVG